MTIPSTTRLKCDVQTGIGDKWSDFVDGGNGCLYGIPGNARRVVEFNVEDKSMKEIGPDLGPCEWKYEYDFQARNGSIYCILCNQKYLLKSFQEKVKMSR